MKQKHTKYTQINTNKSMRSEMGPVCKNKIQEPIWYEQMYCRPSGANGFADLTDRDELFLLLPETNSFTLSIHIFIWPS